MGSYFKPAAAAIDIDTLQALATASKALATAFKAVAAASEAVASAYESAAAAAAPTPRPEPAELKPETKAPLDDPTTDPAHLAFPITDEMVQYNHKLCSGKACKALEYYKDTKGEEFEFVEMGLFENSLLFPYWVTHINFMAKPKDDIPDTCPKLFFAEVYENGLHLGEYQVKMCMTLDPSGPDVMNGCGYVQHDMPHPKGVELWAGPPSGTRE